MSKVQSHTMRSALGLRFWDPVTDRMIAHGLDVSICLVDGSGSVVKAQASPSGHFAFFGLPSLGDFEHGSKDIDPDPLPQTLFTLNVHDRLGRFASSSRQIALPWVGEAPFFSSVSQTQPDTSGGFYLFSSCQRSVPPGMSVIRATLWDDDNQQAAKYALLEARIGDDSWYGIANEQGEVALLFPTPSPGEDAGQWTVSLSVHFSAEPVALSATADAPDQSDVFSQPLAQIHVSPSGAAVDAAEWTLSQGQPLVLRTDDQTRLWVRPLAQS